MFRRLTEQEKKKFKQWARVNYLPLTEINPVWHPVIQAECRRINEEIEIQAGEYHNEIPAEKTLK